MTALSDYLEAALLNLTLRGVGFAAPAAVFVSLHSATPGDTGANEIVAAGGYDYERQPVAFTAPASGSCENPDTVQWGNMPQVTVTHVGIWDAASGGNLLYGGELQSAKAVSAGATFAFEPGDLEVTLS